MSAESPVAAGLKLGRYVLERRIASGGMADVFLARQVGAFGFAKKVALKVLKADVSGDQDHVRMFLREAMVAAEFKHPNLVQVYEVGEEGGRLFLAMELVRGMSLATLMQLLAAKKKSIPVPVAVRIARDALEGLAYAHESVNAEGQPLKLVHRDVSPQNILVDAAGVVKLVDFGIARAETRAGRTQGAQIKGKFGYMAPEQWDTSGDIDGRADVFSLAVVLYEMSTGSRKLFRGQTAPELYRAIVKEPVPPPTLRVADYPHDLSDVLVRALERDVSQRWSSARAMRDALDEVSQRHGWNIHSDDLAKLISVTLDGQPVEARWEQLTDEAIDSVTKTDVDDFAVVALAAMDASRGPSIRPPSAMSGGYPAVVLREEPAGPPSSATVSARPSALGLTAAPSIESPRVEVPATPHPPPPQREPHDPRPSSLPGTRGPSVWVVAALAGWLVALAMGVSWWRTRARLRAIEGSAPVAVAPVAPEPRVIPAPLVLLADATLAESVAVPWAEILQTEVAGLNVEIDRGNALLRMLHGDGVVAVRTGIAGLAEVSAAHVQGFDLRSPASEHVVGYDHAVVVVHPSNPLPSLRVAELAALFGGRVRSFHVMGGRRGAPNLVVCGAGAPSRAFLEEFVLPLADERHPVTVARGARVVVDEAAAIERVANDPSGVAIVRLAWVRPSVRVVPVEVQGVREPVAPTRDNIRAGTYPLVRPVVLYTRAAPIGHAERVARIALSPAGQTLLERAGYVSR